MNYELPNILFVFPYFIEISKNKILISRCCYRQSCVLNNYATATLIKVITKLPNSEQSYKGKVKTHNYINRQNQSTTGKL